MSNSTVVIIRDIQDTRNALYRELNHCWDDILAGRKPEKTCRRRARQLSSKLKQAEDNLIRVVAAEPSDSERN
jgi:hypothetical protein